MENRVVYSEKWSVHSHLSGRVKVMVRHTITGLEFALFYVHSFGLSQPYKFVEAEKFDILHSDPSQLTSTADKLRYYRYKKALLQREIADYAGINHSTYIRYESGGLDCYPPDTLSKIAELLEVSLLDLLDDYNLFLYNGQGRQIRALRERMEMSQREFAKFYGVDKSIVSKWELDKIVVFKSTWERLYN